MYLSLPKWTVVTLCRYCSIAKTSGSLWRVTKFFSLNTSALSRRSLITSTPQLPHRAPLKRIQRTIPQRVMLIGGVIRARLLLSLAKYGARMTSIFLSQPTSSCFWYVANGLFSILYIFDVTVGTRYCSILCVSAPMPSSVESG